MAAPTIAAIRATVVAWWREPGQPRLDVLRARIAALWTDGGASIRIRLVNSAGVWSVVAELETRNADGTVTTVSRTWTPTSTDMQARIETLADVIDDLGTSPRQRADLAAAMASEATP